MTNSVDFEKLKPNQELYLIRYSQKDHPDFVSIKFKFYDKSTTQTGEPTVEFIYVKNNGDTIKKSNLRKAKFRMFIDIDEMSRALYDCFIKRKIEIADEYKDLISQSQDIRPELWV